MFGGQVEVGYISIGEYFFVVGKGACGQGVVEPDDSLGVDQNGARPECVVPDVFFLEVAEPQDAAGQYGPQFFFLKPPFLEYSLIDLVFEGPLRELPEGVYFKVAHAVLIGFAGDDLVQRDDVSVVFQLFLPAVEEFLHLSEGFFVVAINLAQEVLVLV